MLESLTSDDSSPAIAVKPKSSHKRHSHSHSHSHSHKKDKKKEKKSGSTTHTEHSDEKPVCTPSPLEEQQAYPIYGCQELEEILAGETSLVGEGYWREVRLATYKGQNLVVKTLKSSQEESARNKERHRWEAVALEAVKDHPNIVHLLGACECDMITEYFPVFLDEMLLEHKSGTPDDYPDSQVIGMALDAARGLQAIHEIPGGPVVHADLQPRQLLLNKEGVLKLNDLNRCRFMGRDEDGLPCPFKITKANGVWRSPEEFAGEFLTEKLDIYSMGYIFWAMRGRDTPFPRDDHYKNRVLSGERPFVHPSWHPEFVQLFQDMWKREPTERPSAKEVVVRLEAMQAALPKDS